MCCVQCSLWKHCSNDLQFKYLMKIWYIHLAATIFKLCKWFFSFNFHSKWKTILKMKSLHISTCALGKTIKTVITKNGEWSCLWHYRTFKFDSESEFEFEHEYWLYTSIKWFRYLNARSDSTFEVEQNNLFELNVSSCRLVKIDVDTCDGKQRLASSSLIYTIYFENP